MRFTDKQKKIICTVMAVCMVVPIVISAVIMLMPQ